MCLLSCGLECGFDFLDGFGHLDQTLVDGVAIDHLALDVVLPFANCR